MAFADRSVRQQLLLAFGGTVCSFFILLIGLCAAIIFSLSEMVIAESRAALTEQIVHNSKDVLGDVGLTLDAIVAQGAAGLVLPLAVSIFDASDTTVPHSLLAPPSYADNSVDDLAPTPERDSRYTCETGNADLDPQRGCDGSLQRISKTASSVYVSGFALDGSNVQERMATNQASSRSPSPESPAPVAPDWTLGIGSYSPIVPTRRRRSI